MTSRQFRRSPGLTEISVACNACLQFHSGRVYTYSKVERRVQLLIPFIH